MFQIYADSMRIATRTEPLELTPHQARAGKPSFKAAQRPAAPLAAMDHRP